MAGELNIQQGDIVAYRVPPEHKETGMAKLGFPEGYGLVLSSNPRLAANPSRLILCPLTAGGSAGIWGVPLAEGVARPDCLQLVGVTYWQLEKTEKEKAGDESLAKIIGNYSRIVSRTEDNLRAAAADQNLFNYGEVRWSDVLFCQEPGVRKRPVLCISQPSPEGLVMTVSGTRGIARNPFYFYPSSFRGRGYWMCADLVLVDPTRVERYVSGYARAEEMDEVALRSLTVFDDEISRQVYRREKDRAGLLAKAVPG